VISNNKKIHGNFLFSKNTVSKNSSRFHVKINEINEIDKENKTQGFFKTHETNETSMEVISENFYKQNILKQLSNVMISQIIKIDLINREDILENINIKPFNILAGGLFDNSDFFS